MNEENNKPPFWKQQWFWPWAVSFIVIVVILVKLHEGDKNLSRNGQDNIRATYSDNIYSDSTNDENTEDEDEEYSDEINIDDELYADITEGIFLVGDDVEPGIYKSDGNVEYWARLSDTDGEDNIIANDIPTGPTYVEIKSTDKAFESRGGTWTKIDLKVYKGYVQDEYTDGTYLVGKDINPGTYRYKVIDDDGYWARLRNVSGSGDYIIANDIVDGPGYLTINKSDFALQIHGLILTKK